GRRRTVISVVGSVAAHLLVLGALVWVKPPSMVVDVKRGEPLFVELPAADEQAQRGLPPASTPERPKAQPGPRPGAAGAGPGPGAAARGARESRGSRSRSTPGTRATTTISTACAG